MRHDSDGDAEPSVRIDDGSASPPEADPPGPVAGATAPAGEPGADAAADADDADLLGGLDVRTTADLEVPERLVDQVVGRAHARDVVLKAASQRRHVMTTGSPGSGSRCWRGRWRSSSRARSRRTSS